MAAALRTCVREPPLGAKIGQLPVVGQSEVGPHLRPLLLPWSPSGELCAAGVGGRLVPAPLIAGSRSRLQNHLPEARFHRPQLPCGDDPPREVAVWRKSVLRCYSSLSTTFGSSRDARHAGSQLATTATAVTVAITMALVMVSVG